MTTSTTWPNFGLYTLNGNAAAASFVKEELAAIEEEFFDEHDASIVTTSISNRLEALGHTEGWDADVRDNIFAALKGTR